MIHQFRDKNQIAKRKRRIKNIIFFSIFLLLALLGIYSSFSPAVHFIGRPIWMAKKSVVNNIEEVGYVVRTKESLYKENEDLLKENVEMKTSMLDYEILKKENILLKELFGRTPKDRDMIIVNILTKPAYSPYDTIIIDGGLDEDISIGDRVYSNIVTPIGEISSVFKDTSLVVLYSNPGKSTEAMIEGINTNVELIGRGGGNFEMVTPIDLSFQKGSFVVLPSIQSEIVAIVEDIISTPNDPVKRILLSSPVNVQELKWVFVRRN